MVLTQLGGVDAMWRRSKSAIPRGLATGVNSQVNRKADAKHQGLAMALAKLQRKSFGGERSHVAEAHGDVRTGENRASFQDKINCKL